MDQTNNNQKKNKITSVKCDGDGMDDFLHKFEGRTAVKKVTHT